MRIYESIFLKRFEDISDEVETALYCLGILLYIDGWCSEK